MPTKAPLLYHQVLPDGKVLWTACARDQASDVYRKSVEAGRPMHSSVRLRLATSVDALQRVQCSLSTLMQHYKDLNLMQRNSTGEAMKTVRKKSKDKAERKVEADPTVFKSLEKKFQQNYDIALLAVQQDGLLIKYVDFEGDDHLFHHSAKTHAEEIVKAALESSGTKEDILKNIPEDALQLMEQNMLKGKDTIVKHDADLKAFMIKRLQRKLKQLHESSQTLGEKVSATMGMPMARQSQRSKRDVKIEKIEKLLKQLGIENK